MDWVIDLVPFERRTSIKPDDRVKENQWIVHDMCAPGPWPVADNAFDFTICSHTLEDVWNPFHVVAELMRVSKAGYLQMPGRAHEVARSPFGIVPGSSHHRWLVEKESDDTLVFTWKDALLSEFSSLQIHRRVSLLQGLVELYWERAQRPIRTREVTPTLAGLVKYRAGIEGVTEEQVWGQYKREFLRKRVLYKALRTLRLR